MHPKLLHFRYKLFKYRHIERHLASQPHVKNMLDIGCGDGENMLRFDFEREGLPLQRFGLEVSHARLQTARKHGLAVLQGTGETLPFPDKSFDFIYIAHVLHHVANFPSVLAELRRCLADGGRIFVVETVTDHPLLRLGRRLRPQWQGDNVEADWSYAQLNTIFTTAGFQVEQTDRYNLIFFLWEMLPLAFYPFEIFTPVFVYLDLFLAKWFKRYSVHCYFVLQ
jgi:ubiquinone/menaquinone biosynthesis C-methylase UbiE